MVTKIAALLHSFCFIFSNHFSAALTFNNLLNDNFYTAVFSPVMYEFYYELNLMK